MLSLCIFYLIVVVEYSYSHNLISATNVGKSNETKYKKLYTGIYVANPSFP